METSLFLKNTCQAHLPTGEEFALGFGVWYTF